MMHMDNLRIMAWNIQGVNTNVLEDPLFNSYLDNNDIIVLTETWLSEKYDFQSDNVY